MKGTKWSSRITAFVSIALLGLLYDAHAATFYVDSSVPQSGNGSSWATAFKTIQEGIDAASEADTVVVAEGTYIENIRFKGKNIVLRSTDPLDSGVVTATVIDGNQVGSVVTFAGTEDETCFLSGFTIRNGKAPYAAGISAGDWWQRTSAVIENNTITGNSAERDGGGLCWSDGMVRNNTISGNSAHVGAGVSWCDGTVENNTIANNCSALDGGGLYECHGAIRGNAITGNSAAHGGALYQCCGTIQNNTIIANSAYDGGGLCYCHGAIQDNAIGGNSAAYAGGGLRDCNGIIQNNAIRGNSAPYGGGLCNCDGDIHNNAITGNSAEYGGGLSGCDGVIQCNTIARNSSAQDGGGVRDCVGTMQNNAIVGNFSGQDGGGLHDCGGTIENNTITGNRAGHVGGAMASCTGTIRNCIIWGNSAPFWLELADTSLPTYCCIADWTGVGEGNISADPHFVAPGHWDDSGTPGDPSDDVWIDGDYHLMPGSPCINAGLNQDWMWSAVDLDGRSRIWRGTVDIGAYEYRFFVVWVAGQSGTGVQLAWPSTPGGSYTVWWRLDLATGDWVMGETLSSQGDVTSWTDPAALNRAKFYRIEMK